MLAIAAHGDEVVAAEPQTGVGDQVLHPVLGQRGPLQVEEDELGLDPGAALLHPLHERAGGSVGGVLREAQAGVGLGLAQHFAQLSKRGHELDQGGGVELGHLGAVHGEGGRPAIGFVEQSVHARVSLAPDQMAQVPGGRGYVFGDGHGPMLPHAAERRQTAVRGWRASLTSSRPGGSPSTLGVSPPCTSTETRPPASGMRSTRR